VWIKGRNVRGYDSDDFTTDGVAVYLEKDASNSGDARSGSSTDAGSSDHSDPRVSSDASKNCRPLIGDDGYLESLFDALERAVITEREWHEADRAHRFVVARNVA